MPPVAVLQDVPAVGVIWPDVIRYDVHEDRPGRRGQNVREQQVPGVLSSHLVSAAQERRQEDDARVVVFPVPE